MERRKTAVLIGGKIYSFYTDDPEEYIETLEQRANEALREGERAAGGSSGGAVLAIISLTDRLMRMEEKSPEERYTDRGAGPDDRLGRTGDERGNGGRERTGCTGDPRRRRRRGGPKRGGRAGRPSETAETQPP